MLQGGSDFGPAGLPVSENRFFILASLPTDRVFSNIFSVIVTADLTIKRYPNSAHEMRNGFLPERARTWKGYVRQSCLVRREKNISRGTIPASISGWQPCVCIVEECCCKKSGRLRLYARCIDASKRNSCSGMKIWSLLGLSRGFALLPDWVRSMLSVKSHTRSRAAHRRFITSVVRETFSFIALLQPGYALHNFICWERWKPV